MLILNKLVFTDEKKIPPLSNEKYEEFKQEKGFSLAYICKYSKIYGKGYKEELRIDRIIQIVSEALKGEKQVEKMI